MTDETQKPTVTLFDPQRHQMLFSGTDPEAVADFVKNNKFKGPDRSLPLFLIVYANGFKRFVRDISAERVQSFYWTFQQTIFPKPQFPIQVMRVVGDELNAVMQDMPESWRYRWCNSGACGCMGCGNRSGSLSGLGFTEEEWASWVEKNPDPSPPSDNHEYISEAWRKALERETQ
ncbi:hypothetical protein RYA05_02015 [Pseudomonas syringae pv. actinidiae]|nr:hypothetical protein [Pseudomonas syringae pv. actinidiae]